MKASEPSHNEHSVSRREAANTAIVGRVVTVITDGYGEHSRTSFADALLAVKEAQVTVYVRRD